MMGTKKLVITGLCLLAVFALGGCQPSSKKDNGVQTPPSVVTLKVGTYNLRAPKENDVPLQSKLLSDKEVEISGLQEINYNNHRFSGTET